MKVHFGVLVVISFYFCFLHSFVYAKTWYVRPMGYTYSFPVDGSSKDHAFYGLANVVWGKAGVKSGDTLVLCRKTNDPKIFTRTLTIKTSGTKEGEIVITSENEDEPEIISTANRLNYPGIPDYSPSKIVQKGNIAIRADGVNYIKIHHIIIKNCYGCKFTNISHLSIDNVICKNVAIAISLTGGSENLVQNCKIDHVVYCGIGLFGSAPLTTTPLKNCIIRNNECGNSLDGDGITLHCSNDAFSYSIGAGNQVINNLCYHNQEEGLDITSGTDILVEGNETYGNGRCATIAHTAQKIVFKRNYSHDEPGVLIHPSPSEGSIGDVSFLYNIIDSGNNSSLIISENKNYLVMNNLLRNSGSAVKPATVDIRLDVKHVDMKNNIIIAMQEKGYLLRLGYGTPASHNISFSHNCWWQPSGPLNKSFYDKEKSSYNFSEFSRAYNVTSDSFADPKIKDDFSLAGKSPCIDAGIVSGSFSSIKDFAGKIIPLGEGVDIGPIEFVPTFSSFGN